MQALSEFPDYVYQNGDILNGFTGEKAKVVRVASDGTKLYLLEKDGKKSVRSLERLLAG